MAKRNILSMISAIVLIAAGAYLVIAVSRNYSSFKDVSQLGEDFYTGKIAPAEIDSKIAEVREHLDAGRNHSLELLLFNMLWLHAWYYPDESTAELKESIGLGQRLYRELGDIHGPLGYHLSQQYLLAGLPAKLPSWTAEVAARDASFRTRLVLLEFYGEIASDDLEGAREVVDREVRRHSGHLETSAFATSSYWTLGLTDQAGRYQVEQRDLTGMDGSLRGEYALYLAETGELLRAEALLRKNLEGEMVDASTCFLLASCLAVTGQIEDREVQDLLAEFAAFTRRPMSQAEAEAMCMLQAYEFEQSADHVHGLVELARDSGDEFYISYALCGLALELMKNGVDAETAYPEYAAGLGTNAAGTTLAGLADPLRLSSHALGQAQTVVQRQDALLMDALALTYAAELSSGVDVLLDKAAGQFAMALGRGDGAPASDRIADYEMFILDPVVQAARTKNPTFDNDIHIAVNELLSARQELFSETVTMPEVEHAR